MIHPSKPRASAFLVAAITAILVVTSTATWAQEKTVEIPVQAGAKVKVNSRIEVLWLVVSACNRSASQTILSSNVASQCGAANNELKQLVATGKYDPERYVIDDYSIYREWVKTRRIGRPLS